MGNWTTWCMRSLDSQHLYRCPHMFEDLYGKEKCTINLHLHLHLKDTFRDFGPSHSFWCFPFERYNGILGSYPTNNKAVEVQFMYVSLSTVEGRRFKDTHLCTT